jgi:hypothetical protein
MTDPITVNKNIKEVPGLKPRQEEYIGKVQQNKYRPSGTLK